MKNLKYLLLIGLFAFSCSDLEENVIDETLGEDLLTSDQAAAGLTASVYARLRGTFNDQARLFCLQQHTSDETMGPTRGTDWDDNGIWRTLYQHNWDSQHGFIRDVWNELNAGVARATIALNQLPAQKDPNKDLYIAEVRALRAFFSYHLFDLFGVLPTRDPSTLDFTLDATFLTGADAVAFIKGELDAVIPLLKEKDGVPYGRMTKAAAQTLLAKLHLNRAVYQDRYAATFNFAPADMDEVIKYCDAVINSGKYQLSDDYFSIFGMNNETNPEMILPLDLRPGRADGLGGNNRAMMTLHYNQRPRANFEPWNGFTTVADFYNKWDKTDPRFFKQNLPTSGSVAEADYKLNRGFLSGQQYGGILENGAFKKDADGKIIIDALKDRPGNPLIYTLDVPISGANEAQGVRVLKFEPDTRGPEPWMGGTDIPILRLGDVYLMRAEAKLRKGDKAGALGDVNAVLRKRGAKEITDLTLDGMLDQRGFELYWESHRRQDQIRFGKFEAPKTEKSTTSPATRRVFSIPQSAIDANPNLRQNQGY